MYYYDYEHKVSKSVPFSFIADIIDETRVIRSKTYNNANGNPIQRRITYRNKVAGIDVTKYGINPDNFTYKEPYSIIPYYKCLQFITFDTETTTIQNYTDKGELRPFGGSVVMFQFNIDGYNFYCRDMDEFIEFMLYLDASLKDKKCRIKMYVHNLSYDLFYIISSLQYATKLPNFKDYILGDDVGVFNFSHPLFNIEINCSYKLFDKKLEKVAEDYNCEHQKTHDWDYTKFRTSKSVLSALEIEYAIMDVQTLYEALTAKINSEPIYMKEGEGIIWKLPCSKTGEVRLFQKEIIGNHVKYFRDINEAYSIFNPKNIKKAVNIKEATNADSFKGDIIALYFSDKVYTKKKKWGKETISPMTIKEYDSKLSYKLRNRCSDYNSIYKMVQDAYTGGFTHANRRYLGVFLHNLISIDLTSAYPSVMVTKKFVNEYTNKENPKRLKYDNDGYIITYRCNLELGYLLKIKYKDLSAKYGISLISESKCEEIIWTDDGNYSSKNARDYIDNGRLIKCKECIITIYDTDFNNIRKLYDYSGFEVISCYSGVKKQIPDSLLYTVMQFYNDKCYYKSLLETIDKTKEPKRYEEISLKLKIAKTKLNSIYGCTAMDEWKYNIKEYEEMFVRKDELGNIIDKNDEDDAFNEWINDYKKKTKLVSGFTVGGQITSYVREQIIDAILIIGPNNFVYSDTDSIKFLISDNNAENIVDNINIKMQKELDDVMPYIKKICKLYNIDCSWYDTVDREKNLNKFEIEATLTNFKTLGAKRYIFTTSKKINGIKDPYYIHCTVAGISKNSFNKYIQPEYDYSNPSDEIVKELKDNCDKWMTKWFKKFNKGVVINKETAKKLTSVYIRISKLEELVKYNNDTYNGVLPLECSMYTNYEYFEYKSYKDGYKLILSDHNGNKDEIFINQFIVLREVDFKINTLADDVLSNIFNNNNSYKEFCI